MEIAVFQDISGKTQSIFEPGIIKIYLKDKGEWKITKESIFRIDNIASLRSVRESITNMAEGLGDCKIFVGREIKGVAYTILDGMGFNTWELEGTPKEFLEFVLEKEEKESEAMAVANAEDMKSIIQKNKDGKYFLDLKKIQEHNVNLTSKGILLPFLNTTTFYELEIICGHVPPWFQTEFDRLNLKSRMKTINENEIRVTVYPKVCDI